MTVVAGAPLLPFIKRLSEIEPEEVVFVSRDDTKEDSPSIHILLELLELPENDNSEIDLKQAAVYTITYLDKLVTPHLPPVTFSKVKNLNIVCNNLSDQHIINTYLPSFLFPTIVIKFKKQLFF